MTTEQLIGVGGAIAGGLLALMAAAWVWRSLDRAGDRLRVTESALAGQATAISLRLATARSGLTDLQARTEQILGSLPDADTRMATATSELGARRAASDSLRARLVESHATIARVRATARLVMRAIELRRIFLG